MFRYTYSTPSINEIHDIVKSMRSNAAPGPDGLNAAFYKSSWNWVKHDVYKVVTDFYSTALLPLIPKKAQPIIPQDYVPTGLCNVIYKIIAKYVANRVKNHLPDIISQAQSAFIANRHISYNIIITQEIIHTFGLKSWQTHAFILKIDLANLDRIEWSFIVVAYKDYVLILISSI